MNSQQDFMLSFKLILFLKIFSKRGKECEVGQPNPLLLLMATWSASSTLSIVEYLGGRGHQNMSVLLWDLSQFKVSGQQNVIFMFFTPFT